MAFVLDDADSDYCTFHELSMVANSAECSSGICKQANDMWDEDCAIAQISGMALTGRVCEPRSVRQRSAPASSAIAAAPPEASTFGELWTAAPSRTAMQL